MSWQLSIIAFQQFIISRAGEAHFLVKGLLLAFDENVYELRRQKLKQIEALGQTAYRSKYEFTHTIPQILSEYSDKTAEQLEAARFNVRVAGTNHGDSIDGQGRIQPFAAGGQAAAVLREERRGGEKGFELFKLLDLGDHIGVSGYLFRTRTGELTIHVEEITFLSKDLLPLPVGKAIEGDASIPDGPRKWNELDGRRIALPPALCRSGGESGSAGSVSEARQAGAVTAKRWKRMDLSKSRLR